MISSNSETIKELTAVLLEGELDKTTEIDSLIKEFENKQIKQLEEAIFAGVEKSIIVAKSKELAKKLEDLE